MFLILALLLNFGVAFMGIDMNLNIAMSFLNMFVAGLLFNIIINKMGE